MRNNFKKKIIILIICAVCLSLLYGCAEKPVISEAAVMDTIMRVSLYGSEEQAVKITDAVKAADAVFSKTAPQSEVFALNHSMGVKYVVSDETYELIERCLALARSTDGAYNPALGSVIELWGIGTEHEGVPGADSLGAALKRTDCNQIVLEDDNFISIGNTQIDLGGAAKGYALDLAASAADKAGIDSMVLTIGGSVYAKGKKPDGAKYKVGIRDPYKEQQDYFATVELENECVSTSGSYERGFYEGDKYYHHILDPSDGYPAENELVSVTVINENGLLTDVYSTALFVMGLNAGLEFAEQNGIAAVFVTKDKKVYLTPALSHAFTLTDDSYEIAN